MFTRPMMAITRSVAKAEERALFARTLSSNSEKFTFKDDSSKSQFLLCLGERCACIDYEVDGNCYDLVHTNVPDHLQGQGVGGVLAERAFKYIASKNGRMKLTCEYLQHFYKKNQDKYKDLLD